MAETTGRKAWTRDQLVQVLSLYCQLPFGQMHARNRAIVQFATSLGRTPSSVALKLVNLASLDPALRARGIRGMSNASRLDREIWEQYYGNWSDLAAVENAEQAAEKQWPARQTAAERTVTVRLSQGFFRHSVLSAYEGQCCVTGILDPSLLRAGHIVPWSVSEERRLDPTNGICLNALHDAAFDRGFIGVHEALTLRVSRTASHAMPADVFDAYFARYEGTPIRVPERFRPDKDCLTYHLNNIFVH